MNRRPALADSTAASISALFELRESTERNNVREDTIPNDRPRPNKDEKMPHEPITSTEVTEDLGAVEGCEGILVIRGDENCRGWNGIRYKTGMSAKNVGSEHLSMNVATIPPGGVAYAHIHVGFEVMLYIMEGRVRHEYGPGLTKSIENGAGDFIFIKPDVPHEVFNLSDTEPVVAVVARAAADEWQRIVPYDRDSE